MSTGEHARPFLTFHVGQAGVQIGHAIWELLCMEHNILPTGSAMPDCTSIGFHDAMFMKSSSGHFMPRSILVDTDPTCIDEIRVGPYRELFGHNQLISDFSDASCNYFRGRHDYNRSLVPNTVERFRWMMEKTDRMPTVFLIHGISGGTGSGLAVSCMESLRSQFGSDLQLIELNVTSGRSGLQNSSEMINQVLYHYESRDMTTLSFSVTNSAMYNVCRTGLNLTTATYAHLNRMLAMCFSNLTMMERFPGSVPCGIASICNSLLPFKELKQPVLACVPFIAPDMVGKERLNTIGVTSAVMDPDSQLADIDLRHGRHMAGVLLYRGATKVADVEYALASLKARSKVEFVDWAPASFKTGLVELPPLAVPGSGIGAMPLSATLVSNHTAIAALFRGQSVAVRKLAAGSYFLNSYESPMSGGAQAGHNSSFANLLKDACDHMDNIATVYEKGPAYLASGNDKQPAEVYQPTDSDLPTPPNTSETAAPSEGGNSPAQVTLNYPYNGSDQNDVGSSGQPNLDVSTPETKRLFARRSGNSYEIPDQEHTRSSETTQFAEVTSQSELNRRSGGPVQRKKAKGGCCGGAARQRSNDRASRSTSLNHANSTRNNLPGSCSATDTESCRSLSCDILDSCAHSPVLPLAGQRRGDLLGDSNVSTHSADSVGELSEFCQTVLSDSVSISSTISSVRQIIEKYNQMFAHDTEGAASGHASPRK